MKDLTKRLEQLVTLLGKHQQDFEGTVWNRNVTIFNKALTKFEDAAKEMAKGLAPGMRDFIKLMDNPSNKSVLKLPVMAKMFREITGKRVSSDATVAQLKKNIMAHVKEMGNPKEALAIASKLLAEASVPPAPVPKDKEALLLEMHRLGGLSDDLLNYELETRFKKKGDYERLAKAANILVKDREKSVIINDIIRSARRQHGHQILL